jgi:Ca-activated chloride channel family protein
LTSRTILRLLGIAIVSGALLSAQQPQYTLKIDVPYISVDVTVQDPAGQTLNNLPADAFELYENGIRQSLINFSPVSTAYNVLLLFDRSGSTQDKWPLMQRAVAGFIADLRPQDKIAIASFDNDVEFLQPWTGDRQNALVTLPRLTNGSNIGETNFYGAVDQTLRREFRKVNGRRALVVLTDGRDTSFYKQLVGHDRLVDPKEERPFQNVLKTARTERIPAYFIAFNTDRNLEPNTIGADEYRNLRVIYPNSDIPDRYLAAVRLRMEQLADVSGGRVIYPAKLQDIVSLYQQIGHELGTSYSLGYVSSNAARDGGLRQIEVRTRQEGLRVIQSRTSYYAK